MGVYWRTLRRQTVKMILKDNVHPLVFFIFAQCGVSLAFHTLNCDQNQLELKTMETLKCANDHYKELEEMFKPNSISNTLKNSPLGCDFIDRDVACIVDHL